MTSPRIVSLVPSATETVARLGLAGALVGRSHVCLDPPSVRHAPVLTRLRLAGETSRAIHDAVRARLAEGLSIYDVDLEGLRAAAPTHLLVQDQCAVCAVTPSDLEAAIAAWLDPKPLLVRLSPHQLADVWRDIETIGAATGRADAARSLTRELSHRLSDLAETPGINRDRLRVACVEWIDPVMIAGHWVPELVRLAGGFPVLSGTGQPSRVVSLEALAATRPDVVVVQPCGFDLDTARREWRRAPSLRAAIAGWRDARGAPVRVALCDGERFFNRPGPSLVDSAELLAEILRSAPGRAGAWSWAETSDGARPKDVEPKP